MVQMVFLHGVATRSGAAYDLEATNRGKLFKEILFDGKPLTIRAPCWGDLVPELTHHGKSFARKKVASLSLFGGAGADPVPCGGAVAELAKQDPKAALDAIYATMVDRNDRAMTELTADDINAFRAAVAQMESAGAEPALPPFASDEELIYHLRQSGAGSFSIGSWIGDAVTALADRARNMVSAGVANAALDDLNPLVGRFLGDIFVYLKDGKTRTKIRNLVRAPIAAAWAEAKAGDGKLILMGHSLGGVILYDMLSAPQSSGLPEDLAVEAFVTVGSQPGLFEEMGLFEFKSPGDASIPGPACVGSWINIFDPIDVFGFRATPMFQKPTDFAFDSVTGLLSSHTTYFKRPQFYARLRARLRALNLV